jgi:hypothetical protein
MLQHPALETDYAEKAMAVATNPRGFGAWGGVKAQPALQRIANLAG